jgi:hypothetical protein
MKLQYQRYSIYFFLFCGLCYTCLVNASSGTAATTDAYTTDSLLRTTYCRASLTAWRSKATASYPLFITS